MGYDLGATWRGPNPVNLSMSSPVGRSGLPPAPAAAPAEATPPGEVKTGVDSPKILREMKEIAQAAKGSPQIPVEQLLILKELYAQLPQEFQNIKCPSSGAPADWVEFANSKLGFEGVLGDSDVAAAAQIKTVLEGVKGKLTTADLRKLSKLKEQLPEKWRLGPKPITREDWGRLADRFLAIKGCEIAASEDKGGHGGTFRAKVVLDGKPTYLFLKPLEAKKGRPLDETEARNYQVIQELDPSLAEFMPKIYGQVKIGDTTYLIMENTRTDESGHLLDQLADIKLAGQAAIEGKSINPIASQDEMQQTRMRKKEDGGFRLMHAGTVRAPGYQFIVKGSSVERFFVYMQSENKLLGVLKGDSEKQVSKEALIKLRGEITRLREVLEASPLALIGASIIIVRQQDGSLKPIMIDPAHVQFQPKDPSRGYEGVQTKVSQIPGVKQENVFYGNGAEYQARKESNRVAMKSILATIDTAITRKVGEETLTKPRSPSASPSTPLTAVQRQRAPSLEESTPANGAEKVRDPRLNVTSPAPGTRRSRQYQDLIATGAQPAHTVNKGSVPGENARMQAAIKAIAAGHLEDLLKW